MRRRVRPRSRRRTRLDQEVYGNDLGAADCPGCINRHLPAVFAERQTGCVDHDVEIVRRSATRSFQMNPRLIGTSGPFKITIAAVANGHRLGCGLSPRKSKGQFDRRY